MREAATPHGAGCGERSDRGGACRAYKLGKKRWSYNQCELKISQEGGDQRLEVVEAVQVGPALSTHTRPPQRFPFRTEQLFGCRATDGEPGVWSSLLLPFTIHRTGSCMFTAERLGPVAGTCTCWYTPLTAGAVTWRAVRQRIAGGVRARVGRDVPGTDDALAPRVGAHFTAPG